MVTIFIPISREYYLREVFESLKALDCDSKETSLLVYVDGNADLYLTARNLLMLSKFEQKLCVQRPFKGLSSEYNMAKRRQRIAEVFNEAKEYMWDSDYIFIVEDDTIVPPDTLQKLFDTYSQYPQAGFVTGVQIGRHNNKTPGIWQVNNIGDISHIESVLPEEGVKEIDASGTFCMLTKREYFMNHDFTPYKGLLGHDFNFGIDMRQNKRSNYVDWSIHTVHKTDNGDITIDNTRLCKVVLTKSNGAWRLRVT